MTSEFSYNVLKSIIGHLPSEQRFQIAKFCPTLTTAERNTQLHLEVLQLHPFFVQVDWLYFEIRPTDQPKQEKGDFSHVKIHRNTLNNIIYEATSPKTPEEMWKKYLDCCLADRGTVTVILISCKYCMGIIANLPKGLKMVCEKLKLEHRQLETIKEIHPFLTTPFPEKVYISFHMVHDLLLEEELVKQAKVLTISNFDTSSERKVELLAGLSNENICVKSGNVQFKPEHLMKVAQIWLERCPDLRTRLIVEFDTFDYLLNLIDFLRVHLKAVQKGILTEDVRVSVLRHCLTIQMRSGHELNIFCGRRVIVNKGEWLLAMEVMENGSTCNIIDHAMK